MNLTNFTSSVKNYSADISALMWLSDNAPDIDNSLYYIMQGLRDNIGYGF